MRGIVRTAELGSVRLLVGWIDGVGFHEDNCAGAQRAQHATCAV